MSFHFKYFSISQKNSALKVGTDAMVLGAVCNFQRNGRLLDIGTGTGVLAMIVAQRFSPQEVVALEPDPAACTDAAVNFSAAPFRKPRLVRMKVQDFFPGESFDGIISNPPYFIDSTKSSDTEKNNARHQTELPLADLLFAVSRLLSEQGTFWIILPFDQQSICIQSAQEYGLFPESITEVQGKPAKPVRSILSFRKTEQQVNQRTIVIRTASGTYSEEYIALTRELHGKDLA